MYQRSLWVGKHSLTNNNMPLFNRKMGSNISFSNEHNAPAKKSQVIVFHCSSKWKIHYEASKDSNKLMVIYFTASWCGPCRQMEPLLNDLAAKYTDIECIKIDVDELLGVAEEYKVQVMPTFILIKKGKEVDKVAGAKKEELQKKIEKHKV